MVRTSRRQTLLRTTLPAVEQAEPSEEATLDFSSQPADEADLQTAESDVDQEAEQRIDADRLLPVLIQGMDLPQEAKDHLYQEIQRFICQDLLPNRLPKYANIPNLHPQPTTLPVPNTDPFPMDNRRPTIGGPDQHGRYRSGSRKPVVPPS